jgi:hypothetical protein
VLVHRHRELHFLDRDDLLLLPGGALALFLLVEETAIILDTADRGDGVGRNFYQIKPTLAGDLQCFKRCQDSQLFAVFIDNANLSRADTIVNADKGLCRTFVECDGAPPIRFRPSSSWSDARTHPKYSTGAILLPPCLRPVFTGLNIRALPPEPLLQPALHHRR